MPCSRGVWWLPLLMVGCNCHPNVDCAEGARCASGGGGATGGGTAGGLATGAGGGSGGGSGGGTPFCPDGGVCFAACTAASGAERWPTRVAGVPAGNSASLGDVDGDGRLDLAVADTNNVHDLYLALGSGSGFAEPGTWSGHAREVLLADVTGDGHADYLELRDWLIQVRVSEGDGGFKPGTVDSPGGVDLGRALALDLDRDGRLDLAVTEQSSGALALHQGLGGGAFALRTRLPTLRVPWRLAIANLNGDSWPDLVVGDGLEDGGVELFVSNGDFTFQRSPPTPLSSLSEVLAEDLDQDGRDEVYAAGASGLYRVTAGGAEQLHPGDFLNLQACDTDGDGRPEVVGQLKEGLTTFALVGGKLTPRHTLTLDTLFLPAWLLCRDLDSDGADDVLVPLDTEVGLFRGGPHGLGAPPVTDIGPFVASWLEAVDLDVDGWPDLVGAMEADHSVAVWFNQTGALLPPLRLRVGEQPRHLALADLDGDGRVDVVTANRQGTVSALMNLGGRSFATASTVAVSYDTRALTTLDLGHDGRVDVVAACRSDGLHLLFGRGQGGLAPARDLPGAPRPLSVAAGDFDGDRQADLVASGGFSGARVLRSEPDGGVRLLSTAGADVYDHVLTADFDRDGQLDVLATGYRSGIWFGDGQGDFPREVALPPAGLARALDVGGDGWLEAVTLGSAWFIDIAANERDGGFAPPRPVFSGSHPHAVAAADFNRDGRLDLVVATERWPSGGTFTLLDGTCGW